MAGTFPIRRRAGRWQRRPMVADAIAEDCRAVRCETDRGADVERVRQKVGGRRDLGVGECEVGAPDQRPPGMKLSAPTDRTECWHGSVATGRPATLFSPCG